MEIIDIKKFKRNPNAIKKKLKKSNNTFIATDNLYIMFPTKYIDKGLAVLDNICEILGVFIVYDDNLNYSVLTIPSMINIEPNDIIDAVINNNEQYMILHIEKGQPLFNNLTIIKSIDTVFPIFDLMLLQGKIPWFINYIDFVNILIGFKKYAGSKVGNFVLGLEALAAINARDMNNPDVEFRMILKNEKDIENIYPEWVGLKNIYYSFKSTLSKLAGSYFKQGIIAGIVKPEDKTTDLEYVLRK